MVVERQVDPPQASSRGPRPKPASVEAVSVRTALGSRSSRLKSCDRIEFHPFKSDRRTPPATSIPSLVHSMATGEYPGSAVKAAIEVRVGTAGCGSNSRKFRPSRITTSRPREAVTPTAPPAVVTGEASTTVPSKRTRTAVMPGIVG